jgi:hypothetical protein
MNWEWVYEVRKKDQKKKERNRMIKKNCADQSKHQVRRRRGVCICGG